MPRTSVLPWRGREVPHAVLDIGRGCDVACRACYNHGTPRWRGLDDLRRDLAGMRRARRLQAVTIVGGEPTLHPDLPGVVGLLREAGIFPILLSNGRGLDGPRVAALAAAGLGAALVHVDGGQTRDDLGAGAVALRAALAQRLDDAGIAAGFQVIAYRSRLAEVVRVVRELLASPHAHHLLVTGCTDLGAFHGVEGSLATGLRYAHHAPTALAVEQVGMRELRAVLLAAGLQPCSSLPDAEGGGARWLGASCLVHAGGRIDLGRSPALPPILHALRWATGRQPFRLAPSTWRNRAMALLAGRPRLGAMQHKVVILQQGPRPGRDGSISICRDCPDATWHAGRLVPVCLADRMAHA